MIKIEKGIPVPECSKDKAVRYPWKKLKVGESFLIEDVKSVSLYTAKCHYQRRTGKKFTTRKLKWREKGNADYRVWRIQ
jgi:hypothetical protein